MIVSLEVATRALQHYIGYKNIMHTSGFDANQKSITVAWRIAER